jgi:putative phosphoesterase
MRIAAIYDIHGHLPALEAVLREIEQERPDLIVVGGDVAAGPLPRPTIERLMALAPQAHFVRGNADRELVAAFDGLPPDPKLPQAAKDQIAWSVGQLDREHRDFLASFTPPATFSIAGLGDAVFCHGSPRDEDEIITARTTDERLARIVAAVRQPLVVCGHTHMQFDRRLGGTRVVNAGSVGMPYGDAGAFWVLLGPTVSLRRTDYDFAAAAERIRAGGFPWADDFVERNMRHPASANEAATLFEGWAAKREQRAGQVGPEEESR